MSTVSADNLVRHLLSAGKTWKAYAESLPSTGYIGGDVYVLRERIMTSRILQFSPLSLAKGEGRVRVDSDHYDERPTPHLNPLPLIKGRGGLTRRTF